MRCVAALVVLALLAACGPTRRPGPYDDDLEVHRDPARAEALSREAADLIATEPERAERLLREALADLFCGPAHNNLGVLHLVQGQLYEAAHEFEWARKLMPGHPDPRVNLALVMERAGRDEEAVQAYRAALEVRPGYLPAVQGLASLTLRTGVEDPRLDGWLRQIALEGETEAWREWARGR